jgi:hypothetical protein
MNTTYSLLHELDIDADLALRFFIAFSRFEFALKASGHVRYSEDQDSVSPDWNGWMQSHNTRYDSLIEEARAVVAQGTPVLFSPHSPFLSLPPDRLAALDAAVDYMTAHPPKVQTIRHGMLDWRQNRFNGSRMGNLVKCVKTVRNNLFHGGKYNSNNALLDNPTRNRALLTHSLAILNSFLLIDPRLKQFFEPQILDVLNLPTLAPGA